MSASGWEVRFSNSRKLPYFFNTSTNQSVWEAPAGLSESQVQQLPGARQFLSASGAPRAPEGQVRASHILAKHTGSRRPSSWRQDKITRSPAEARQIIEGHISELQKLQNDPEALKKRFAEIAASESDCSSAHKGGDLGIFGRGQMQKSFEDGTYALQPGQLSPVIESDSGIHVILRTA